MRKGMNGARKMEYLIYKKKDNKNIATFVFEGSLTELCKRTQELADENCENFYVLISDKEFVFEFEKCEIEDEYEDL